MDTESVPRSSKVRFYSISKEDTDNLLKKFAERKKQLDTLLEKKPNEDKVTRLRRLQKKFPVFEDHTVIVEEEDELKKRIHNIDDLPSLIKYSNPIIINVQEKCQKYKVSPMTLDMKPSEILNIVFPPRCWINIRGQLLRESISLQAAGRVEITELTAKLDLHLNLTDARPEGLCAYRRELYAQCFDELIRQVTVESVPSGLLLLNLRDDIIKTDIYNEKMLKSAVEFGNAQAIIKEDDTELAEAEERLIKLKEEEVLIAAQVLASQIEFERIKTRNTEYEALVRGKKIKEVEFLKSLLEQYKFQKENLGITRKSSTNENIF